MKLGDEFPNFTAETSHGSIDFHTWLGGSWAVLFSHPADYTPVCTTELAKVAELKGEFDKRGVKLIALSCNNVDTHKGWIEDIKSFGKISGEWPYPIIADPDRHLAVKFGMLDPDELTAEGLPLTARCVFFIGPDRKMKASILYPATTGRYFLELLRVIDSLQLTAKKPVATPVNWKPGDDVMVAPTVKEESLAELFPKGVKYVDVPSGKKYIRMTPQPDV